MLKILTGKRMFYLIQWATMQMTSIGLSTTENLWKQCWLSLRIADLKPLKNQGRTSKRELVAQPIASSEVPTDLTPSRKKSELSGCINTGKPSLQLARTWEFLRKTWWDGAGRVKKARASTLGHLTTPQGRDLQIGSPQIHSKVLSLSLRCRKKQWNWWRTPPSSPANSGSGDFWNRRIPTTNFASMKNDDGNIWFQKYITNSNQKKMCWAIWVVWADSFEGCLWKHFCRESDWLL